MAKKPVAVVAPVAPVKVKKSAVIREFLTDANGNVLPEDQQMRNVDIIAACLERGVTVQSSEISIAKKSLGIGGSSKATNGKASKPSTSKNFEDTLETTKAFVRAAGGLDQAKTLLEAMKGFGSIKEASNGISGLESLLELAKEFGE